MSHPYDASTKYLVQVRLADWLPLCGRTTTARVEVIDADLATVTAAADRVLRVHEDPPWLLHLELQSSRDPDLAANLHVYNALLERRHGLRARSLVVLLRRQADAPDLTGVLQREFPGEPPYLTFRYQAIRVWQMPVETILAGGLGVLPLAPLSAVSERELPGVIARIQERIDLEATAQETGLLWTATDVLMGLRYSRDLIAQLMQGVRGMKESVTYQAIVEEGMVKDRQDVLLEQGAVRFGTPSPIVEMAVRSITDLGRLKKLTQRLLNVSSWDELLTSP
jgi:predicted transposase YdaD